MVQVRNTLKKDHYVLCSVNKLEKKIFVKDGSLISFSLFNIPVSLINTDVTSGSVYVWTWMFKCLNLSQSLKPKQSVCCLWGLEMQVRSFSRFREPFCAYENLFILLLLQNNIWFQGRGCICLTNQGYTERQRITHSISVGEAFFGWSHWLQRDIDDEVKRRWQRSLN